MLPWWAERLLLKTLKSKNFKLLNIRFTIVKITPKCKINIFFSLKANIQTQRRRVCFTGSGWRRCCVCEVQRDAAEQETAEVKTASLSLTVQYKVIFIYFIYKTLSFCFWIFRQHRLKHHGSFFKQSINDATADMSKEPALLHNESTEIMTETTAQVNTTNALRFY